MVILKDTGVQKCEAASRGIRRGFAEKGIEYPVMIFIKGRGAPRRTQFSLNKRRRLPTTFVPTLLSTGIFAHLGKFVGTILREGLIGSSLGLDTSWFWDLRLLSAPTLGWKGLGGI